MIYRNDDDGFDLIDALNEYKKNGIPFPEELKRKAEELRVKLAAFHLDDSAQGEQAPEQVSQGGSLGASKPDPQPVRPEPITPVPAPASKPAPAPVRPVDHIPDPAPTDGEERTLDAFYRTSPMHLGLMNRIEAASSLCDICTKDKLAATKMAVLNPTHITVRDNVARIVSETDYHKEKQGEAFLWVNPALLQGLGNPIGRGTEKDAVFTLASMLFATVFCTHPFVGKQFFVMPSDISDFYKLWKKVVPTEDFIFADDKFDPDRGMINGVHEVAHQLWLAIGERRRALFLDALMGRIETREELCARWEDVFTFRRVYAWSPCKKRFPCMLFNDGEWLVVTKDAVARSFYCRRLEGKSMEELCAGCTFPEPRKQVTGFATLKVALIKGGEKVRDLYLAPAAKYSLRELTGEGNDTLTVAVSTKRNDLLLLYTEKTEVSAILGDSERVFAAGENVPLLPSVTLKLGNTDYALCAPTQGWHV